MSIVHEWAEYCAALEFERLPDEVVEQAKKLILDIVGNAIGGYHWMDSGPVVHEAVTRLERAETGPATVLPTGRTMSPEYASLINGTTAHSLDYDNHHAKGVIHTGSSVVTAAIAAAEDAQADGRTLIEGAVAGYEVACRLAMACNPHSAHEIGFHPTGTCGIFGATAAIGKIRGSSPQQLIDAFGINGSQASGSMQYNENGAWNKRAHPGFANHSAFIASALAESGFIGAALPIEGDYGFLKGYCKRPLPEAATRGLGETYETLEMAIKPYPLCRYTHMVLELLINVAREEDLDPADVLAIDVNIPEYGVNLVARPEGAKKRPSSPVEAQFSAPFAAALALTEREAGLDTFNRVITKPFTEEFERLMQATTVSDTDEVNAMHPEKWPARVSLVTTSGTIERFGSELRGEPGIPMPWEDLDAKFAELTTELSSEAHKQVVTCARELDARTVTDLIGPLRG